MPIEVVQDTRHLHGRVVPGCGSVPNRRMIVGERPGETEAIKMRPFAGRSGAEQRAYLDAHGLNVSSFYITNVCKDYAVDNPDPTPGEIARWTPELEREIATVRPDYILAVGRFAVRWFLGPDADMDAVHGIPHRSVRAGDALVLPCFHPAYGFYEDDARVLISHDYKVAADIILGRVVPSVPVDSLAGNETYIDVSGDDLADLLADPSVQELGLDTEGIPRNPWSIQVSPEPGVGYVLRRARKDFLSGIAALQRAVDRSVYFYIHNGMYDIEMSRVMGLDLFDARIFDTMYAAYIMRTEPQALKPLAYRWTGCRQRSYSDTVGAAGLEKQLNYLATILEHEWPKPEPRVEHENDGTFRLYTPQPVERRAESILADYYSGKLDKDGNRCDPEKRWHKVNRELREAVESRLGEFPIGTLADIPLDDAVYYAGRDPDVTLRTARRLIPELERRRLTRLMQDGMDVLPIFEQMQSSGMPGNRAKFQHLHDRMWDEMCRLQSRISHRYYGGQPINPGSPDKVAALMRRRGLEGAKVNKKTGKVSTAKKSIEHLRYEDECMADVIDWRERQKIKDAFCIPALNRIPRGVDVYPTRTTVKTTRVATRRISASDPNLTATPVRHTLGKEVRDCYEAPDGEEFGSWDLSQIEMRYMAHESRDELLIKFFNDSRLDVHCETAARIFGLKVYRDAPTKEEMYSEVKEMEHRYPSKRAGFGIITNIQGEGLLDQLRMFGCKGWDKKKCDDLIREWLKVYKGVARYLEACKAEVHAKGYVVDRWGMPRYLPGVYSVDKKVVAEAERAASSHKIQGGAQGMIQRSMAWAKPYVRAMQQAGLNVRWVLQIHDELILRFSADLWDTIDPLIREALTQHSLKLVVPVKCSGSHAKSWGKLK